MKGCAVAQAISHQPVTVETSVQTQASPYRISDRQNGTGTGFTQAISVYQMFHTCISSVCHGCYAVLPFKSIIK
jgi:hypothetical protein